MTDNEHEGMKKCTKCGEWKPATAEYFYAGKKYRDGFRSYCRGCLCQSERRYREKNKEKIAEYSREYRQKNKRKISERQLEYSRSAVGCLAGALNRVRRKTGATIYLRDMTDEEKETLANQYVAIRTLEKTEKELLAASGKKRCTDCGRVLDYCFFYRHHSNKDGLGSWCKECCAEYRREYYSEYYQQNKDKANEYYEKNKDRIREYYEKNKDKIKEYVREYREKNKDKIKEYQREYYQKNRAWLLEKDRERRGSKKIDDDDDYSDLYPLDERNFGFRSWAVITSAEYAKELTAWQIADTMEETDD